MSFQNVNMSKVLAQASKILIASDKEVVMPALNARRTEMEAKGTVYGETDYVTQIDIENEAYLLERLQGILPAFATGEESFDNDPDTQPKMLEGLAWIVDPLDGTNNVKKFIAGESDAMPSYGIMAALLDGGRPIAGWILAAHKGRKLLAAGATGFGATLTDLDTGTTLPITLPTLDAEDCAAAKVVTTITAWPNKIEPKFGDLLKKRAASGLWTPYSDVPKSAAVEAMMLLRGEVQAAVWRQFRAWDHLPAAAIIEAAGGCMQTLESRHAPTITDQRRDGILATPAAACWEPMRRAILGNAAYSRTEDPKLA